MLIGLVAIALVGLVLGSFLEEVAERVPGKERLSWPRRRCASCQAPQPLSDGIALLSWVRRGSRRRTCHHRSSVRGLLLELGCAGLFVATTVRLGLSYELPAYLVLGAGLLALSAIDLEHKLLPNRIVYPTGCAVGLLLLLAALAAAEPRRIAWALAGGGGSFGVFFLLHLMSPSGMAFGDVRLSFVLGLAVGWLGLSLVPLSLFLAFLSSAVVGIVYAVVSRKGLKVAIPFGPFLAFGAEVAIFSGRSLLDVYLGR